MLASDVGAPDALISNDLIFTTHHGAVMSKHDDLAAHLSDVLKFHKIELSERRRLAMISTAFVSVLAKVSGVLADSPFEDDIRFCLRWQLMSDNI